MKQFVHKYSEKEHKATVKQTKKLFKELGGDEAIKYVKRKLLKLKRESEINQTSK